LAKDLTWIAIPTPGRLVSNTVVLTPLFETFTLDGVSDKGWNTAPVGVLLLTLQL
jgi:hypothetical protein